MTGPATMRRIESPSTVVALLQSVLTGGLTYRWQIDTP